MVDGALIGGWRHGESGRKKGQRPTPYQPEAIAPGTATTIFPKCHRRAPNIFLSQGIKD